MCFRIVAGTAMLIIPIVHPLAAQQPSIKVGDRVRVTEECRGLHATTGRLRKTCPAHDGTITSMTADDHGRSAESRGLWLYKATMGFANQHLPPLGPDKPGTLF